MDVSNFGYLQRLTLQLTIGASQLDRDLISSVADYIVGQQREDGGWAGREGASDLYYTSFALRSLAILGLLQGKIADGASKFLRSQLTTQQSIVDLLSLIYSHQLIEQSCDIDAFEDIEIDWMTAVSSLFNDLRRDDGGFAKTPEGRAGSTYQTFLIVICAELLDKRIPETEKAIEFLKNQQQDDGGFLEIRVAKRSGVNPTAAAIGALRALDGLTEEIGEDAAEFLLELHDDSPTGFTANTRIPLPDVLSSFTGLVTLWELNRIGDADLEKIKRYVDSMYRNGSFAGFELDPESDIEYTFYGLGALAMICAES